MERIYGIDPGYIEKQGLIEVVNNKKEYELFQLLRSLHMTCFYMEHDGQEINEDTRLGIAYLENLTTKFGVKMKTPGPGIKNLRTDDFMKWYDFWYYHFENMTQKEWKAFEKARKKGEDVSDFLPKGKWNDPEENRKGTK